VFPYVISEVKTLLHFCGIDGSRSVNMSQNFLIDDVALVSTMPRAEWPLRKVTEAA